MDECFLCHIYSQSKVDKDNQMKIVRWDDLSLDTTVQTKVLKFIWGARWKTK